MAEKLLDVAVGAKNFNAVRALLNAGTPPDVQFEGETVLQLAAREGDLETARLLLEAGSNVSAPACWFGTALQNALEGGNTELVRLILDAEANINALPIDKEGNIIQEGATALQRACLKDKC